MALPYYTDDMVTLHHGDCLDVMRTLPDNSVDAVVCDPPYDLTAGKKGGTGAASVNLNSPAGRARITAGFMGQSWDGTGIAFRVETWAEAFRVLKPGGHLLAFGGTRTWHRLAVAVEDAGFEMRDSIAWLYGSGFPKSLNLTGDRQGWGTALKPAFEPVVVARKPLVGTVAANVLAHGTGALNVDGCRVGMTEADAASINAKHAGMDAGAYERPAGVSLNLSVNPMPLKAAQAHTAGRWPTNVLLDGSQAEALDEQSGTLTSGKMLAGTRPKGERMTYGQDAAAGYETQRDTPGDSGGASRFFPTFRYEAKAPTAERPRHGEVAHPTVKPLDLMRWLVRLVTPPGGVVLEPFAGSGTTAEACVIEGFRCIAIEREAAYLPLIVARLSKPIQVDLFGGVA